MYFRVNSPPGGRLEAPAGVGQAWSTACRLAAFLLVGRAGAREAAPMTSILPSPTVPPSVAIGFDPVGPPMARIVVSAGGEKREYPLISYPSYNSLPGASSAQQ